MRKTLFILLLYLTLTVSAFAETAVYTAKGDDESAVDVSGNEQITLTDVTVMKTGGNASSADAASFRGVNSAVRVYDHAMLTISDSIIEASAQNATGVFAYDHGTVYILTEYRNIFRNAHRAIRATSLRRRFFVPQIKFFSDPRFSVSFLRYIQ